MQEDDDIKSGSNFYHEPTKKVYKCIGTDDGMIWWAEDDYSTPRSFERSDCEKTDKCPECNGTGEREGKTGGNEGIPEADVMFVCSECGGSGKVSKQ